MKFSARRAAVPPVPAQLSKIIRVVAWCWNSRRTLAEKTAITLATVAALGAAAIAAPTKAEARGWGWGPGIGLGIAAGVVGAGLAASTWPGYAYGPGYGYYGPRYYRPAYYGGPYAWPADRVSTATATGAIATGNGVTRESPDDGRAPCALFILRRPPKAGDP